jgi:hypothetical protein
VTTKRELVFWQRRRDNGSLIAGLRSHRERAIRFFGAVAVLSENEKELYRTLEAHEIVSKSPDELLAQMKAVVPEDLRSELHITSDQISSMLKRARQHLNFVLGQEDKDQA